MTWVLVRDLAAAALALTVAATPTMLVLWGVEREGFGRIRPVIDNRGMIPLPVSCWLTFYRDGIRNRPCRATDVEWPSCRPDVFDVPCRVVATRLGVAR